MKKFLTSNDLIAIALDIAALNLATDTDVKESLRGSLFGYLKTANAYIDKHGSLAATEHVSARDSIYNVLAVAPHISVLPSNHDSFMAAYIKS